MVRTTSELARRYAKAAVTIVEAVAGEVKDVNEDQPVRLSPRAVPRAVQN